MPKYYERLHYNLRVSFDRNKSIYLIFINTLDIYSLQENSTNFTYKYFNDKRLNIESPL